MTTKPEWEQLAEALECMLPTGCKCWAHYYGECTCADAVWPEMSMKLAAAELRRLGEENEELRETAKACAKLNAVLRDQKHYTGSYTSIARRMLVELDASRVIINNCVKSADKDEARMAAVTHLVHQLHSAKGRYHTQNALCALFDAFGLSNTKPERKAK